MVCWVLNVLYALFWARGRNWDCIDNVVLRWIVGAGAGARVLLLVIAIVIEKMRTKPHRESPHSENMVHPVPIET